MDENLSGRKSVRSRTTRPPAGRASPSYGERNMTPCSVISASSSSETIWKPPESVSSARGQPMNPCSPPNFRSTSGPWRTAARRVGQSVAWCWIRTSATTVLGDERKGAREYHGITWSTDQQIFPGPCSLQGYISLARFLYSRDVFYSVNSWFMHGWRVFGHVPK